MPLIQGYKFKFYFKAVNLTKPIWLDKFDDILSYACSRWNNSTVICGDMNFDLPKPDEPIQKRYLSILSSHNLNQHVKKPSRKTTILDQIMTNSIAEVKHVNVIPCPEVSDHDAPYITLSTKSAPVEKHYNAIRLIRDLKTFDSKISSCILFLATSVIDHNTYKLAVINLVTKKSILVYLKAPYWVPYCSAYMSVI